MSTRRARRRGGVRSGDRSVQRRDQAQRSRLRVRAQQLVVDGVILDLDGIARGGILLAADRHRPLDPGRRQAGPLRGELLVVVVATEVAAAANHEEGHVAGERRRPFADVGRGVDERAVRALEQVRCSGRLVEQHQDLDVAQLRRDQPLRADRHVREATSWHLDRVAVAEHRVEAVGDAAAVAVERGQVESGEDLAYRPGRAHRVAGAAGRARDQLAGVEELHLAPPDGVAMPEQEVVPAEGQLRDVRLEGRPGAAPGHRPDP